MWVEPNIASQGELIGNANWCREIGTFRTIAEIHQIEIGLAAHDTTSDDQELANALDVVDRIGAGLGDIIVDWQIDERPVANMQVNLARTPALLMRFEEAPATHSLVFSTPGLSG